MTGVSVDAGIEILGKRVQLPMEAMPKATKVAYLAPQIGWEGNYGNAMREIASRRRHCVGWTAAQQPN